jgi:pyridoxal phosphate enzyme (YggS family)
MSTIRERLFEVRERIQLAARTHGRDPATIRLIAVSKRQPAAAVREAYQAGQRLFGENYAQELAGKARELADLPDLRWHVIGHLQSNKARVVAPIAAMIHTVDSSHLASELGHRAAKLDRSLDVLIEVNVAGDPAKSGCSPKEVGSLIQAVRSTAGLALKGLMTMPPLTADLEDAKKTFAALRALQILHGGRDLLGELSMGMSQDLEAAIAEGATLVRVGTAIFGTRTT